MLVNNDGSPVICGFGRSRIVGEAEVADFIHGNVRYMAPELLESGDVDDLSDEVIPVTQSSDIYSFAMVGVEVY